MMMELLVFNFMVLAAIIAGVYFFFQNKHVKRLEEDSLKASRLLLDYYNMRNGDYSAEQKFKFAMNFDKQVDEFIESQQEEHVQLSDNVKLISDYKQTASG